MTIFVKLYHVIRVQSGGKKIKMENKKSMRKIIGSTVVATSLVFLPSVGDQVFAYGGPENTSANQNTQTNVTVTEPVKKEEVRAQVQASNKNSSVISKGDTGEAVRQIQQSLNDHGANLSQDGIFGSNTENAVKDFQRSNGLAVDGKVGPQTSGKLFGDSETAELNAENNQTTEDNNIEITETNEVPDDSAEAEANNTTIQADNNEATVAAPQTETLSETVTNDESNNVQAASGDIVSIARSLVGSPYVGGGTTPAGFDSSGFINYVFKQAGVDLNRTHQGMWDNDGVHVDSPQVGDVVFFENTYDPGDGRWVTHSGIYIGNNQMIHAGTPSTGVEITNLSDYWQERYIGAKSFK